jgi:hypothetical protein
VRHFNTHPSVIRRPGSGLDRVDQVLVNHSPMGRREWRLKPFIDRSSRVFASSLISVRPLSAEWPLEYLWALCASPIAQFYAYCFMLKRNIHTGILGGMPVPNSEQADVARITSKAKDYLQAAGRRQTLLDQGGVSQARLSALLLSLDAEVLRLYDLPADAERLLLDQFAGAQRPGVPFPFTAYYPTEFKAEVPFYAFLSDTFQQFLRGLAPRLTDEQEQRYDALVAKSDAGRLAPAEIEELHWLQAEVDGCDCALQAAQTAKSLKPPDRVGLRDARLKRLDDRLASITLREI